MPRYRVTAEITTTLSAEVEANSAQVAEQFADAMALEYEQGQHDPVIGTEQHRHVEIIAGGETRRWRPVGE
jgi:hypothetical protein